MRVLVVVHGFPPTAQGGSEIYAEAHARTLHREFGDDILVLTREGDPSRPEYDLRAEQCGGLRVLRVNNTFRQTRTFEQTYRNDAISAIACRIIDDFKPDVAHIHHLTCLSTGIVRSLAARNIPCCVTLHDYWFICHRGQFLDVNYGVCDGRDDDHEGACGACLGPAGSSGSLGFLGARAVRAMERRLPAKPAMLLRRGTMELADLWPSNGRSVDQSRRRTRHMREVCADVTHFLAPSQYISDRFERFGIALDRITVAGYGFDRAAFQAIRRMPSERLRLGFLGSLMISKGPHVLLEAVASLPPGSVSVDLYGAHTPYHGDDSYRHRLAPLLQHPDVRLHGPIPHESVAKALASIDVLVVPSIWPENSPLVIHEAFLAGVPVVASRAGGIPELVKDGQNGLLVEAGNAADLADAVTRLLTERNLINVLRAGLPAVRSIEDDVRQARDLYHRLRPAAIPAMVRPPLAAIVLNFGTPADTLMAVQSLLASRRPIDEIIVVDNASSDDALTALANVRSRITYVSTGTNLGFCGGMNVGIREALNRGAQSVLLVNSDVIVPPDCVERLERCLERHGAGIAGPVILARSEPGTIASLGMSYSSFSGRMRHRGVGARMAVQDHTADRAVDAVSGCLMLIRREVFDAVGLLDEDYFFSFEELDFCLRARRAGFAAVLDSTAIAHHEGGRSIGADTPLRLYFAARNHLLLAHRNGSSGGRMTSLWRVVSIVLLNIAHAVRTTGAPLPSRLWAVARGTRDYAIGRFGAGPGG